MAILLADRLLPGVAEWLDELTVIRSMVLILNAL